MSEFKEAMSWRTTFTEQTDELGRLICNEASDSQMEEWDHLISQLHTLFEEVLGVPENEETSPAERPEIEADRGQTIELFYGESELQGFWQTPEGEPNDYLILQLIGQPGWTVYRDLLLVTTVEPTTGLTVSGSRYLGGPTAEAAAMQMMTQYGVELKLNREQLHPWTENQAKAIPLAPGSSDG